MKTLRKILSDQEGATLVMVALMLVVLMGITSLVADVGILTKSKRQLIATADAAALAGAQELADVPITTDPDYVTKRDEAIYKAKVKAKEYAEKNYPGLVVDESSIIVNYTSTDKSVTVPLTKDGIGLTFAQVLGHDFGTVAASAQAAIEYPVSLDTDGGEGNLLPFCIQPDTYDNLEDLEEFVIKGDGVLHDDDGNPLPGNWGTASFYDLGGKIQGGNDALKYLASAGYDGKSPGDLDIREGGPIATKPGTNDKATADVEDYRLPNPSLCFGLVPIVRDSFDKGGRDDNVILGFTMFEILDVEGKGSKAEITGRLNPKAFVTDFKGTTTSDETYNYGAKVITLVD